jgi:hypothetical protein
MRRFMMMNHDMEETEPGNDGGFIDEIIDMHRWQVTATVYTARHQGLRAGVRPKTEALQPGDEKYPPVKRVVFIEFPEKTLEWGFTEIPKNTAWLDSLPQYDQ